jgi:amino acid permease
LRGKRSTITDSVDSLEKNTLQVFAAIKGHSIPTFKRVVLAASLVCMALYVPTGIFGFMMYGTDVEGDVLLNFKIGNVWADVGRVAMALTVILAYPINHLPTRSAVATLIFPTSDLKNFSFAYFAITGGIFACTLGLAIGVPGLQTVFGMFGATFGVCLVFFFPAMLHVKFAPHEGRKRAYAEAAFISLIGLFVGIAGGTMTMVAAVTGGKD